MIFFNRTMSLSRFDLMIVGKYFDNIFDFMNLTKVCKKYEFIMDMYHFNPVPDLNTLFSNTRTKHLYNHTFVIKNIKNYVFIRDLINNGKRYYRVGGYVHHIIKVKSELKQIQQGILNIMNIYFSRSKNVIVESNFYNQLMLLEFDTLDFTKCNTYLNCEHVKFSFQMLMFVKKLIINNFEDLVYLTSNIFEYFESEIDVIVMNNKQNLTEFFTFLDLNYKIEYNCNVVTKIIYKNKMVYNIKFTY